MTSQRLFFAAAAIYAAVAPWLLVASMVVAGLPRIPAAVHARGLLFGYVGALIAGYLLGRTRPVTLYLLFTLWLAGRLAELAPVGAQIVGLLYAAYGLLLAILVTPKFRAAKKWRNRVAGPVIAVVTCYPLVDLSLAGLGWGNTSSISGIVLPLALLIFFMGGRVITPALAVAFARKRRPLPQRVQPRLEGAVILLLLAASGLYLLPVTNGWTGLFSLPAGLLVLLRVYRWRLFSLGRECADIHALGIGYLWLGIGLVAFSMALLGLPAPVASLHVIAVGALGTLSCTIMLKLAGRRVLVSPARYRLIAALLSLAVVLRFAADFWGGGRQPLLVASATVWSLNYAVVSAYLIKLWLHNQPAPTTPRRAA